MRGNYDADEWESALNGAGEPLDDQPLWEMLEKPILEPSAMAERGQQLKTIEIAGEYLQFDPEIVLLAEEVRLLYWLGRPAAFAAIARDTRTHRFA